MSEFNEIHPAHVAAKEMNSDHKVEYHENGDATVHVKSNDKDAVDNVIDALHDKKKQARSTIPDSSGYHRADNRNIKTKVTKTDDGAKIHIKPHENAYITKSWFDKLSPLAQEKYKKEHQHSRVGK